MHRTSKSHEILVFVFKKTPNYAVRPVRSIVLILFIVDKHKSTIELGCVTSLFCVVLKTSLYQNLVRTRHLFMTGVPFQRRVQIFEISKGVRNHNRWPK